MRCGTPSNVAGRRRWHRRRSPQREPRRSPRRRSRGCAGPGFVARRGAHRPRRTRRGAPAPGIGPNAARDDRCVLRPPAARRSGASRRHTLERVMPVEVVGLEVEEDGDARTQRLDVFELERRELAHDPRLRRGRADEGRERTADVAGDLDGRPAERKTAPSSSVVVVLPFVPVTPRIGFGRSRAPSSISLHTGTERARALSTSSVSPGTPGLFTTRSIPCSSVSSSLPR